MCPQKNRGGTLKETTLWTNPSPSSNFTAQAVTLSDTIRKFDFIRIYCKASTTDNSSSSLIVSIDDFLATVSYSFKASIDYANISGRYDRAFNYINDTSLQIDQTYQVGAGGTFNNLLIPTQITGCKM